MFCAKDPVNDVSRMAQLWTASETVYLEEVNRNVLLCDACYWDRLLNESGRRKRFRHGTFYGYSKKHCRCEECISANRRRNDKRAVEQRIERATRAGSSTG